MGSASRSHQPRRTTPFADCRPTNCERRTYARLLIPICFRPAERALYLARLRGGGGSTDLWRTDSQRPPSAASRHGHGDAAPGVIALQACQCWRVLMNLPVWRRERLSAAATAFIRQHQPGFLDQTAINAACAGRICYVHERWNFLLGAGHIGGQLGRAAHHSLHRRRQTVAPSQRVLGRALPLHRRQTPSRWPEPRAACPSKIGSCCICWAGGQILVSISIRRRARAFVEAYLAARARSTQPPRVDTARHALCKSA